MRYKINEDEILEILQPYDEDFYMIDTVIYLDYAEVELELDNNMIEKIKNKHIDKEDTFITNITIEKLHGQFNECFEEINEQYSLTKVREFLENLKYKTDDEGVYYNFFYRNGRVEKKECCMTWHNIMSYLNVNLDEDLDNCNNAYAIVTLLVNNKDKLLEDEE